MVQALSICLLPVGRPELCLVVRLRGELERILGIEVRVQKPLSLPADAYDPHRGQYMSARLLDALLQHRPRRATRILGITDVDMCTPVLTFVFGEAQLSGPAAIVSHYRLRQEYYGLAPNWDLTCRRTVKEAIHEIGHTFGLVHCPDPRCVMRFSARVVTIDTKNGNFCHECSTLLAERQAVSRNGG